MEQKTASFTHPHDTGLSAALRFSIEIIACVTGPWALSQLSSWWILPSVLLLVVLPGVFSTPNDKRIVLVAVSGKTRIAIEAVLYLVAIVSPWFIWPHTASTAVIIIALLSLYFGIPRLRWLYFNAPSTE